MSHASEQGRTANLLNALALHLTGVAQARLTGATGRPVSDTQALVALALVAPGASQGTLAAMLRLSQSAVTRLVDRLAAVDLVVRSPGGDHRTVALRLTVGGERLADQALMAREVTTKDLLGVLDLSEQEALANLLGKLLAASVQDSGDVWRTCRLCDTRVCHDVGGCPVTLAAANRAGARRGPPSEPGREQTRPTEADLHSR